MCCRRLDNRQVRCGSWTVVCQLFSSLRVLYESYSWWLGLGSCGFLSVILVKIPCQLATITDTAFQRGPWEGGFLYLWLVMLKYDLQKMAIFSGWNTEINQPHACQESQTLNKKLGFPTSVIKITISPHIAKITFALIKVARWLWLENSACHGL